MWWLSSVSVVTLLRVSQAAALLGVSDDTVRRYIAHDRLPVSRVSPTGG